MMSHLAILIPLLPLLAGVTIGLLGSRFGERSSRLGVAAVALSFAGSVGTLWVVSTGGPILVELTPALAPKTAGVQLALYLDRLSAVMLVLITGVSSIVHLFSIRYMQGERGYARFFALLGVTTSALLWLVSSANLLMLFVFWQLISWLLYLLLAYNYQHQPATDAAFKTFFAHRIGDVAFLGGLLLAYAQYDTLDFGLLFVRAAEAPGTLTLWPGGVEISAVTGITLLIFVGAMAKSAQFPLHVWLPDTMDTPTPVSALMHAGMVNAGGFLINRLAPLYGLSPSTLHIVFVIGALTAVLGATMMLTQSDVKKRLGFSTMGQMGYMTMECGLGAFALAIFHLIAHGIFKATLFLSAGSIIHEARHDPKFPPGHVREEVESYPRLPWFTGVTFTLLLPLAILLATHDLLHIPLRSTQGAAVFLFFAWVTSSQAILSLYRLKAVGSWKVAGIMVIALGLVVSTYLWAAEAFTHFLYPLPGEASRYFEIAAFPLWLFDLFVAAVTLLIIGGWVVIYTNIKGQHRFMPSWVAAMMPRFYVWFWNRLFIDALYAKAAQAVNRLAFRVNARFPEWLP